MKTTRRPHATRLGLVLDSMRASIQSTLRFQAAASAFIVATTGEPNSTLSTIRCRVDGIVVIDESDHFTASGIYAKVGGGLEQRSRRMTVRVLVAIDIIRVGTHLATGIGTGQASITLETTREARSTAFEATLPSLSTTDAREFSLASPLRDALNAGVRTAWKDALESSSNQVLTHAEAAVTRAD